MHRRVAALFGLALLSGAIPAHIALASTDAAAASPIGAVQAFIAGIVNGTEAIIAAAETGLADVVATVDSGIASLESSGDSVSYSAAAAASQASPAASPSQPPPVDPFGPPHPATTTAATQVVVEKEQPIVEETSASGATISPSDLHGILTGLSDVLSLIPSAVSSGNTSPDVESQIAALQSAISNQGYIADASPPLGGGAPNTIAAASAIDNLSGVTITNANLTASEIPALDYLSLSGGTLAGDLELNGDATTTGTSYFSGNLGIGTSTAQDALAVNGSVYLPGIASLGITANRLYANGGSLYWAGSVIGGASTGNWTGDGTNVWRSGGNVGIGTTSPSDTFSVAGNGYFTGGLGVGVDNTTAGTLQTSGLATFNSGLLAIASSTIGNGTQTGGLTISGGATTTGNSVFQGSLTLTDSTGVFNGGTLTTVAGPSTADITINNPGLSGSVGTLDYYTILRFNGAQNKWYFGADNSNSYLQTGVSHNMWFSPGAGGVSSTTAPTLVLTTNRNVGIGTTSPATTLSVSGNGYLTGGLGVGLLNTTAGTIQSAGNILGGGTLALAGTTGTTTIAAGQGFTIGGSQFVVQQGSGNLGIGTASPSYPLDVNGAINIAATAAGYKQAGNTVLYASTTNQSLAVGASAAAAWMSASSTVWYDVAIGQGALATTPTSGTAQFNTAVGYNSLSLDTTGQDDTANGTNSLNHNTTGSYNLANGMYALFNNTTGSGNVATGYSSLYSNTTGSDNTANSDGALSANTTGNYNVASGLNSLLSATSSSFNTAVGTQSGQNISGATGAVGSANTLFGYDSGYDITLGSDNTILGNFSTVNGITTGSNNILIGQNVTSGLTQTGSNQLNIGNLIFATGLGSGSTLSSGNVGIGTSTPSSRLEVFGSDAASSTSAFAVVNTSSTTVFAVFDGGNAQLSGTLTQSSDQRLKTNIQNLDGSSSLAEIDALNPVTFNWIDPNQDNRPQLGFIAQQVQGIFPSLVSTTSATALTPGGTLGLNYIDLISPIVAAIQELDREVMTLASTVAGFAESFTTNILNSQQDNTQKLCVGSTCVTPAQFQAMVAAANQSASSPASPSPAAPEATDTPPVIQINGDNPAVIQVGASYTDLGATITGPQADLNLGIQTYLNGTLESPIELDTTATATDTIAYVVTESQGLTSTSTRTIIVELAAVPPTPPPAGSPAATSSSATSTPQ